MRVFGLALTVFCVSSVWAALCGITWPGWEVSTSEASSSLAYPVTNMLDGDPRTAWVYHKGWRDLPPGVEWGYAENPDADFNHGIGTILYVTFTQDTSFVCDGIGIINGYAKDRATYQRNNRITKVTLDGYGPGVNWSQSFALQETLQMQRLPVPHLRLSYFSLRIDAVQSGADDDLCISDLVLYHGKSPIPWQLTPSVLSTPMVECDGYPIYSLVRGHSIVALDGKSKTTYAGFPQPHASRVLLHANHTLYLYDLRRDACLWRRTYSGTAHRIGWQNDRQALLQLVDLHGRTQWYRLDAAHLTWQRCAPPSEKTRQSLRDLTDEGC